MKNIHEAAQIIYSGIANALPGMSRDDFDRLLGKVRQLHHLVVPAIEPVESPTEAPPAVVNRLVYFAPRSTGRMGNPHRPMKNAEGAYVCIVCATVIEWSRVGRVPVFCPLHRKPSHQKQSPQQVEDWKNE